MDARILRPIVAICALFSLGASYRTEFFIVSAPTPQLAQEIGQYAEHYRRTLAVEWLGKELPPWSDPCPIQVQVSPNLGAGGATSFMFRGTQPFGWRMTIQGSRERILDSVLPHEITHTIFATHFGRPLPRWADEGACTTVEHSAERHKQEQLLIQFLTTNRGIAFNQMFAMMEYPTDMLPLYSQGYALAQFFIAQGGKRKFVQYVGEGMRTNNWTATTRKYYGYESLSDLQVTWVEWIRSGRQVPVPLAYVKAPELHLAAATQTQDSIPQQPASDEENSSTSSDAFAKSSTLSAVAAVADRQWEGATSTSVHPDKEIAPRESMTALDQAGLGRYAPGSTAKVGLIEHSATRPQPLGRTQQQVLEWERSSIQDASLSGNSIIR
jgi:hypothetical protein